MAHSSSGCSARLFEWQTTKAQCIYVSTSRIRRGGSGHTSMRGHSIFIWPYTLATYLVRYLGRENEEIRLPHLTLRCGTMDLDHQIKTICDSTYRRLQN